MGKIVTLLGVLLISSTGFSAQECNPWSGKRANVLADLHCEISRPNTFEQKFTLSVLEVGACQIKNLGSISEFGTLRITNAGGYMDLTVDNERGIEILKLDLTAHVKNKASFYFRMSFPQQEPPAKTAIVGCEVRAPEISE